MRHWVTVSLMVAVAALAAIAVAGCGSSSSTTTTATTAAISKAAFVAKANALCVRNNQETERAFSKLTAHTPKSQDLAVVSTVAIPSIQTTITSVRALGAPAGEAATVTHFLNLAQADLNKVKNDPELDLGEKDQFADFAKIAHPYGLVECDKAH